MVDRSKKLTTHSDYIKQLNDNLFYEEIEINSSDVLFVIDMQNDFVDRPYSENGKRHKSGKLPTHNSKRIIPSIIKLVKKFKKNEAMVVATRDYHTKLKHHCSFPIFGEHCVIGSKGSDFVDLVPEIEKELIKKNKFQKNCQVVYKADNPKIDSFGAFPYTKKLGKNRICGCTENKCPVHFTGSWGLSKWSRYPKMKNIKKIKINKIIKDVSKKNDYVFICGVLGDFCVLDTARNARAAGYKNVVVVIDLIRNLRIKEKGKITYPTSPAAFNKEANKHGFSFILSKDIK